ncbi:MAG: hypothetical protein LDLANPLL_01708 [Turneriella sp.]|nr:hypothetical protein [Turneriella sp.]
MILKKSAANPKEKIISIHEKPFLVAEFGLNHNRDIGLAQRMVDAATKSGVDAIKLQSYTTRYFINRTFENMHGLYDIFQSLEIGMDFHRQLRDYAVSSGLAFISAPLTLDWVENLDALEVPAFKIASGDVTNTLLVEKITTYKKPIIASTGAASQEEIQTLIDFFEKQRSDYALLHCVSLYPTPNAKANIARMGHIANLVPKEQSRPIGFSDHTEDVVAAFAAVSAGAQIIEKHFTLDKSLPGPDQKMSFSPQQMAELRKQIDLAYLLRGQATNANCHNEETAMDYYGKRSLYEFEGEVRAMRPRIDTPLP